MALKTNRLFSLQLADHDGLFGPKDKPTRGRRILQFITILPALIVFVIPSYKLGRVIFIKPTFSVPTELAAGQAFTVPMDASLQAVQAQGRQLTQVKKQELWIGAASSAPTIDLDFVYKKPQGKFSLKALMPHFEHPMAPFFSTSVKVDPAAPEKPQPGLTKQEALVAAKTPPFDTSILTRADGAADAACWKEPKVTFIDQPGIKRHAWSPPRMASLTSAAGGEITKVEGTKETSRTIVVYHGGGLYTVYSGIKDIKVRQGEKISSGQMLGTMLAGTVREPNAAKWSVYLAHNHVTPESFLALSSRLCGSK